MTEFVEYIAKSLVSNKEAVNVSSSKDADGTLVIKLVVASEDLGKVIGKQGKIANAIRTMARAISRREGENRVVVKIDG